MSWHHRAACGPGSGVAPQDFSPTDGRGRVDLDAAARTARTWCAPCPVRADCLTWASGDAIEVVAAGYWFPSERAIDPTPIALLNHDPSTPHTTEEAAAA